MRTFDSEERLALLRQEMKSRQLGAFILPMEDSHFSEYLAAADKRIAFISGFTGSAGTAVITATDKAALWTDGRYHSQAAQELDKNWILMREGCLDVPTIPAWLVQVTRPGCRIGFDPQQMPFNGVDFMQRQLDAVATEVDSNRSFVPIEGTNLVDLVWKDRPSRPTNPIRAVPLESFALYSWEQKLDTLREQMKAKGVTALVIFQLDEIAWLFNLRGSDINYNPLFFSFVVATMDDVHLFVEWRRGLNSVDFVEYFKSPLHRVLLHPYEEFSSWLNSNSAWRSGRVWLPSSSSYMIASAVPEKQRLFDISPLSSLKAVKNPREVEGMRLSNLVDSLALCDFLAWLEDVAESGGMDPTAVTPCDVPGVEPPKVVTEASVTAYLNEIRLAADGCLGLSFPTIPGADANGAIIHYYVGESGDSSQLTGNSLFLLDSGGQYTTGTTDVTRTVHLGVPTEEQVADYTQVLKAHASLATLTFPDNTTGTKLDVVCRASMWRDRRDFPHGTGHGVGANLCVHEGPIGMSGRRSQALSAMGIAEPGIHKNMVLTIEPGYYLTGKYGIRLENVVLVVESPQGSRDSATPFLSFEALTLVPFQRRLIDVAVLDKETVMWVDAYHSKVRERLLTRVAFESEHKSLSVARRRTRDWILRETEPLCVSSTLGP
ncbi:xaa pro aminopeptidase [Echinococcus multilocularis]|uniref:Xaa pro aminopeptidase n=1 Tax=Echinococcus multilocularis TaxID=6211 RepID=A0A068YFP8_ECHMU|nr:xaa pro aminopeptidase [Echinococcus multilocularis]